MNINTFSINNKIFSHRALLLSIGLCLVLLGIFIAITPYFFFKASSLILTISLVLVALIKSFQFLLGKSKKGYSLRGIFSILISIAIDIALAYFIFSNRQFSFSVIAFVIGIIFIADGVNQFIIAWHTPTARGRVLFLLNSLFTAGLGIITFIFFRSFSMEWISLVLGLKIASLGLVLIIMVLRSKHDPVIYTKIDTSVIRRTPGELYACYFGAAFHLGVYIGNNEMVHYRDDDIVHRTSWEEFLRGREPQHWVYPDLPKAKVADVIKLAISQAGQKSKYSIMNNNCEHYAIYWKSGGATRFSKYAQISSAVENMNSHPVVGSAVELYGRAAEYIAFNFGGLLGHKASFNIRRFNSLVTAWMLSSVRTTKETPKA